MKRKNRVFGLGIVLTVAGSVLIGASAGLYYWMLPDVGALRLENPKTTAYIQHYVRRTIASGKKPVVMMRWVPLNEISPYLRIAVIKDEDDLFYTHDGIDWGATYRAIQYDSRKKRLMRGASTITQQVARNLYLSPERSLLRKLKEMAIAIKLEQELTKDRILEIYLNIAEWGKGIYGAQAASEIYFGKNAADLDPNEAAALAVALPSPWSRNPSLMKEKSMLWRRKEVILARMRKAGYLLPGVSEKEIDVPGTESGSVPTPASAPAKSQPILKPAPCDAPAKPQQPPPDSCGPQAPPSFFNVK